MLGALGGQQQGRDRTRRRCAAWRRRGDDLGDAAGWKSDLRGVGKVDVPGDADDRLLGHGEDRSLAGTASQENRRKAGTDSMCGRPLLMGGQGEKARVGVERVS